jgi:hypothetical protein
MSGTSAVFANLKVIVNHECFSETLTGPTSSQIYDYTISDPMQ